jgi:UDP-N-acetylmuramoyl-L-alanyl-D-glutamate--2,6-diaminopimelate ligase
VFGCGGERDRGKRPEMGRIAAELADDLVITDDNPRGESPAAIAADIVAGLPAPHAAQVVHDRATAIRVALDGAAADDIVLIAGKGHESYQLVGDERRDFSDRGVVRTAFAATSTGDVT